MSYLDTNIDLFCTQLASSSPTPGGGGAGALCGALAAALCSMVCELTKGKAKYAEFEENTLSALEEAERLQKKLLSLIDGDAEAFLPLSRAYAMPKSDSLRDETMESALLSAAGAPLEIMRCSAKVIELCSRLVGKSSILAASDIGCASALAEAALKSSAVNVRVNTAPMKRRETADAIDSEADGLLQKHIPLAQKIYDTIWSSIS